MQVRSVLSASVFILITWKADDLKQCYGGSVETLSHSRVQYSNLAKGNQESEIRLILSRIFCFYGECYQLIPSENSLLYLTLLSCAIIDTHITHIHDFCPQ